MPEQPRLNICICLPSFLPNVGGAEKDAQLIFEGLAGRGHKVSILTQKLPEPCPARYNPHYYRRPPAMHLWPELLLPAFLRAHDAIGFNAMLAFYSYPCGYVGALAAQRRRFAVVSTPQGGDLYPHFHALKKPRVARTIRAGYKKADRLVPISGYLVNRLREFVGEPLPPIDLVYNGLDLEEHDRLLQQAKDNPSPVPGVRKPYVLHLARVAPVKQQTHGIRAVHHARAFFRNNALQYVITGDGNAMEEARALAKSLEVEDIVHFTGTRTGPEKYWLLANAKLGVSASREEGFGNVLIELMASGVPMLASDIETHQELIGSLGWGRLYKHGDTGDFAEKLVTMLTDDLSGLQQKALATRERFSIQKMIDGYEDSLLAACRAKGLIGPVDLA